MVVWALKNNYWITNWLNSLSGETKVLVTIHTYTYNRPKYRIKSSHNRIKSSQLHCTMLLSLASTHSFQPPLSSTLTYSHLHLITHLILTTTTLFLTTSTYLYLLPSVLWLLSHSHSFWSFRCPYFVSSFSRILFLSYLCSIMLLYRVFSMTTSTLLSPPLKYPFLIFLLSLSPFHI